MHPALNSVATAQETAPQIFASQTQRKLALRESLSLE